MHFRVYSKAAGLLRNTVRNHSVQQERDHHILVLSTGYNGLTQRVHTLLADKGHDVKFRLAISPENIRETVNSINPDFVICPFLQQKIPDDVCKNKLCLVFHPGIPGDGGPHAIDWAILNKEKEWGGILLEATDELDAGDIWAAGNFPMGSDSKASIYRRYMTEVAVDCVNEFLEKYDSLPERTPEYTKTVTKKIGDFEVQGKWRDPAKQNVRKVNWLEDSTEDVVRKINSSDSAPGVAHEFFGRKLFMYGAHTEGLLKGAPATIIAKRKGAICMGTKDGAVWITHLREPKGSRRPYKLPATMVLGEKQLKALGIQESSYNIFDNRHGNNIPTFRDIWYEEQGAVGILHFDFHNGAMATEQCIQLRQAYKTARNKKHIKVLVLSGGKDFFSNGIHLNMIEAAENPSKESWKNITAINGVVREILTNTKQITVSAVEGNAGAGGVFFAIAADHVITSESTVLNPHYKTMGLFGSEYSTYTTPKRIGEEKSNLIRNQCLPLSADTAKSIGLTDEVIPKCEGFDHAVIAYAQKLANNHQTLLEAKVKQYVRSKADQAMVLSESSELRKMYDNFNSSVYHTARHNFVHKACVKETPLHLVDNNLNDCLHATKQRGIILNGNRFAAESKQDLKQWIQNLQKQDPTFLPGLAIVQVGDYGDSNVYVNKKLQMAEEIGIKAFHFKLSRETTSTQLVHTLEQLNAENHIHGVMLQLPLDCKYDIDVNEALDCISPSKDVDALGATNRGLILGGDLNGALTCTPAACLELIMKSGVMIQGARAVVIGRSVVVGGIVAELLKWHNATVINCHEHTHNLQEEVKAADILVVGAGIPNYVQGSWVKEGAVVIDAGINLIPDKSKKSGYRIVGDVEFSTASKKASYITPVPGGVGPMTVQMLMKNTVKTAASKHFNEYRQPAVAQEV